MWNTYNCESERCKLIQIKARQSRAGQSRAERYKAHTCWRDTDADTGGYLPICGYAGWAHPVGVLYLYMYITITTAGSAYYAVISNRRAIAMPWPWVAALQASSTTR